MWFVNEKVNDSDQEKSIEFEQKLGDSIDLVIFRSG